MTTLRIHDGRVHLRHITDFVEVMFPLRIHLPVAFLWAWSVESLTAVIVGGSDWKPLPGSVLRGITVAATLLFMRMIDEQKDLGYDRVHHPDRPLVAGAVSPGELRAAMAMLGVPILIVNGLVSAASGGIIALVLSYGLGLWWLEHRVALVRDNMLIELAVALPIQAALNGYLIVSSIGTAAVEHAGAYLGLMGYYSLLFLHVELARKTATGGREKRLYTNFLGANGSGAATLLSALAAIAVYVVLVRPWQFSGGAAVLATVPIVAGGLPLLGALRYWAGDGAPIERRWPVGTALGFVGICCLTSVALGAAYS
ncbi:hypothetical protein [Nocardia sp. NPDC050175]|uniref:hypothetical protein n=1 Tax=Nocardia sp. NPDC050175 TaxID=3364317 RepID=UPI0037B37653